MSPGIIRAEYLVAPRTGGRGLKYNIDYTVNRIYGRPPHRGAWIEMTRPTHGRCAI